MLFGLEARPSERAFRDMAEPDLWLATDGHGRWGEMNGAHRTELDGCVDLRLPCTPFTHALPIHRLPLHDGDSAELPVVTVDVETLDVRPQVQRYTRQSADRWRFHDNELDVDEHGLVLVEHGRYRRVP